MAPEGTHAARRSSSPPESKVPAVDGRADPETDVLSAPAVAQRTVRGAGVRLVAYGLSAALSVVGAAVLLRYLGVSDYGRYATVFALVTIVGGVTEAATANLGVRELAVLPRREHEGLLAELQGVRLALTLAGVGLALAFVVLAGYPAVMVEGAALAGAGLLLTVFAVTLWVPLQASLQLARVAALELLRQALTVVVLVAGVAAGAGLALLLGAQIPVALALVVAGLLAARAPLRALRPAVHPARWRRLLAETVPYAAATAIGLVYTSSVVLVMSLAAGAVQTGLYGAASRVFLVLAGTAGVLVGSAFPVLARAGRDDHERLRVGVQRLFDAIAAAGAGLALVTVAGAPVAVDVVAGAGYGGAVEPLRLLGPALLASYMIALGAFALLSLRRQAVLIGVNAAGLAVCVALALWWTPGHGAVGGAWATLVGESLIALLSLAALARAGVALSLRIVPRVFAACAVAAVPLLVPGLAALPAALLVAALYAGAALALGLVPAEARSALVRSGSPRP